MSSLSDKYQTPKRYVIAAKEVMGSINLDPACSYKNYIRLEKYITNHYFESGLIKDWFGLA